MSARALICPDVSEFQNPLDTTYDRDFVIFRVTFGAHYLDKHFAANAAAAAKLHRKGRLAGALLYTVYTADSVKAQFRSTWDAIGPTPPPWLAGIVIDVESWRGQPYALSGDHSDALNRLAAKHAKRLGSWRSVLAYGNTGDLAALYPHRDPRCRAIVAAYTSSLVYQQVHGAIGQQYTDGERRWGVPTLAGQRLPRTSGPFGKCDHNVFPGVSDGAALVTMLRPDASAIRPDAPKPAKPAPAVRTTRPVHHTGHRPTVRQARPKHRAHPDGTHATLVFDDWTVELRHRETDTTRSAR